MTPEQVIKSLQDQLNTKVADCEALVEKAEAEARDFNEDEEKAFKSMQTEIKVLEGRMERQRELEKISAHKAVPVAPQQQQTPSAPAFVPSAGRKTIEGQDFIDLVRAKIMGRGNDYFAQQYAEQKGWTGAARILKAATAPADTTTSGWASQLVEQTYGEFLELLRPASIFMRSPVMEAALGPNGKVVFPQMTGGISGGFVGEGGVIPVKQATFSSGEVLPYNLKIITVATREVIAHSNPAIDRILRDDIVMSTATSLDGIYVDNTAASAGVRPAGLEYASTSTATTGGTGTAGIDADIEALLNRLSALNMSVTDGHFIVDTAEYNRILFAENATSGVKDYQAELMNGRFFGAPIIASASANAGVMLWVHNRSVVKLIDTNKPLDVAMSDQATLHFEDTTPLDIGTAGTPPTVAAPAKNLFQTDSVAFRLVFPASWGVLRTGGVQAITGISW